MADYVGGGRSERGEGERCQPKDSGSQLTASRLSPNSAVSLPNHAGIDNMMLRPITPAFITNSTHFTLTVPVPLSHLIPPHSDSINLRGEGRGGSNAAPNSHQNHPRASSTSSFKPTSLIGSVLSLFKRVSDSPQRELSRSQPHSITPHQSVKSHRSRSPSPPTSPLSPYPSASGSEASQSGPLRGVVGGGGVTLWRRDTVWVMTGDQFTQCFTLPLPSSDQCEFCIYLSRFKALITSHKHSNLKVVWLTFTELSQVSARGSRGGKMSRGGVYETEAVVCESPRAPRHTRCSTVKAGEAKEMFDASEESELDEVIDEDEVTKLMESEVSGWGEEMVRDGREMRYEGGDNKGTEGDGGKGKSCDKGGKIVTDEKGEKKGERENAMKIWKVTDQPVSQIFVSGVNPSTLPPEAPLVSINPSSLTSFAQDSPEPLQASIAGVTETGMKTPLLVIPIPR
eukprot:GHVN01023349.1.p2 GENE.GHVN01023349.1~~GHVN01023349.1.p2  ORF type:complete len:455 (-),score=149.06 GHVN01023349.1:59-1423(-)